MAFIERGMAETISNIDFKPVQFDFYKFNVQTSRAATASVRDPFSNSAGPQEVGGVTTANVYLGQMLRDFIVPIHSVKTMGDTNDQTAQQAQLSADKFFDEFVTQHFHGDGSFQLRTSGADGAIVGNNLNGWDFWLDVYCGKYKDNAGAPVFTSSTNDNVLYYASRFAEMKQFGNLDEAPTHVKSGWPVIGYKHLDNAISLIKGRLDGLVIVTRRRVWNRILESLRASGGNTQTMIMGESKVHVPLYDGIPVLISDNVGAGKTGTAATTATDKTVVISGSVGMSDLDIGRVIKVVGGDFGGGADSVAHGTAVDDDGNSLEADETIITSIVDNRTVEVAHAAGATVAAGAFTSDPVNVLYVTRYGNQSAPLAALYGAMNAAAPNSAGYSVDLGEYYGTIAGFDLRSLGEIQAGGAYMQYRATWDGNFVNEDPFNLTRYSNFKLA